MRSGAMTVRWGSAVIAGVLFTTLLVLTGGAGRLLVRETSGSTYLCTGYSGCNSAGYSDSGYGAVSHKMYWRMYSGHNCVNYVAYRMIQAGMSTTRPWTGSGNAANWGHAMARITDQTPAVGAVAWWDAYHHVGSAGHVAYIEKVNSPTDITISEDSWSGTFHWQRITKDSGFWPSGFIHFKDKDAGPVLANKVKPFVSGDAKVGSVLTGHVGTWTGKPSAYSYQWLADGVAVRGATKGTFTPTADQLGKKLALIVTGSHPKSTSVGARSVATSVVVKGSFVNSELPTVTGEPVVGETLTVDNGGWSPAPARIRYNWRADGQNITGATSSTLQLTPDLAGKQIAGIVHVKMPGYKNATRMSAPTKVLLGHVTITRAFTVKGRPVIGGTLRAVGAFTPADATAHYQWLRAGQPIPGATAATYRPTGADAGQRLSVQVSLERADYLGTSGSAATTEPVRADTRLQMHSAGTKGGAVVRVRVVAPGLQPVTGTVRIRIAHHRQRVTLVNGVGKVEFTGLWAGHYVVHGYFLRNSTAQESNATGGVTVR